MDLMDVMLQRRSIRKYTGERIPAEALEKIMKAGLLAPTSRDLRPCEFYVVRDRKLLEQLAGCKAAGAGMIFGADAAVAVFADENKADTWIEDSSIALAYMNLMAVEQGIGSCWVQLHMRKGADGSDAEDNARRVLSVNDNFRIVGILALGMPAEVKKGRTEADLEHEKVHLI